MQREKPHPMSPVGYRDEGRREWEVLATLAGRHLGPGWNGRISTLGVLANGPGWGRQKNRDRDSRFGGGDSSWVGWPSP